MSRINLRPGALLAPLPCALVSCGSIEKPNIITIGWTGIISTIPPRTYISVRPKRYSHSIIEATGEFVINLCPSSLARAADYCGTYTGAKVNKFEKCGITAIESEAVSCPSIAECPVSLECRVSQVLQMGSHDMFIADIVSVSADEALLDKNGKLHFERADLVAYSHGEYFTLGKKLGSFGFSAVRKKKRPHAKK